MISKKYRAILCILIMMDLFIGCSKGDTEPPLVAGTNPSDGATGVYLNSVITVFFSEKMDTAAVMSAFDIAPSTAGSLTWTAESIFTFTPSSNLDSVTGYTVTVTTEARDTAGNAMDSGYEFSFTTGTQIYQGRTYYVAPGGSDGNPGTITAPWKTVQHAADMVTAGDTVFLRAGTYGENVLIKASGNTLAGDIVFSAYTGELPVIDGTGNESSNGVILSSLSYLKLLGLEIRNWNNGNAVWIEYCHHVEISDCEVHDADAGIGMGWGTHDFVLNRVAMHHFDLYGFDASPGTGPMCHDGTLNDCVAYTGRDNQQNVDGFALGHGDQYDFTFERCLVYDVYDGFDMSSKNVTLHRCCAHDCWNSGYKLWQNNIKLVNCLGCHSAMSNVELDWSGTAKTATLQNCTFVDAGVSNIWVENSQDGLNMYNCIVAGGDNIGLCFEQTGISNYHGDYNIFHNDNAVRAITVGYADEFSLDQITSGEWTAYSGDDAHSFVSNDPAVELFVDWTNGDLHLVDLSIAIDQGTSQGAPADDYDGNPRPAGSGYDIGAFEHQ
jgi:hypothetical protein